jgi:hypothetical protein
MLQRSIFVLLAQVTSGGKGPTEGQSRPYLSSSIFVLLAQPSKE